MFEIKGKYNTAKCYTTVIEEEAIAQIKTLCDSPLSEGSNICIMPDAHAGVGCTIGTTMTIADKICVNLVGLDIGCNMYTTLLGMGDINLKAVDEAAYYVPSGMRAWDSPVEDFDLTQLHCYDQLKNIDYLKRSLGTLGGGNHFIEIDADEDVPDLKYLIIHSGSRNLGKQVAEIYQKMAIDQCHGVDTYEQRRVETINNLKSQGRQREIQQVLIDLKKEFDGIASSIPDDLCYLTGDKMADYLHDVEICQRFAARNTELIAKIIIDRCGLIDCKSFHTTHNYIDVNEMVLRKGAIAAHFGQEVLIPINMRDGSILAVGCGNPEWNYSAPHGAGRIMSRKQARENLSLEDFKEEMDGIYTTSVNENTIDESPMAYKSIHNILPVIRDTVMGIRILKPIYNFKASE